MVASSLGEALVEAWGDEGLRHRKRPPARGWRAMLMELTYTGPGQAELVAAGTGPRSWEAWLSEEREPNERSQQRIRQAYERWFGPGWPNVATRTHAIYGRVVIGDDDRERGTPPHAPFRANAYGEGSFHRIIPAWNQRASAAVLEQLFVEDVIGAIEGISFSTLPEFPGQRYRVDIE